MDQDQESWFPKHPCNLWVILNYAKLAKQNFLLLKQFDLNINWKQTNTLVYRTTLSRIIKKVYRNHTCDYAEKPA